MEDFHASSLPGSVAWVAERLGMVGDDGHVSVGRLREVTVGQIMDIPFIDSGQVHAFVSDLSSVIGGIGNGVVAAGRRGVALGRSMTTGGPTGTVGRRTRRARERTAPTRAEKRGEMTTRIAALLEARPGSTLEEIAVALDAPLNEVTIAARPVDWLILSADELEEPTERVESETIRATRERARAAMQAANLLASPLSHQTYTSLVREGRVKGPSVARIVQLFGSWTAACAEVGVTSGEPLRKNYERTWTPDDLLGFVERFLADPRFRGASHQYDKWRATLAPAEKVPSLGTVRNLVGGTWNDIRTTALRRMRSRWAPSKPLVSQPAS